MARRNRRRRAEGRQAGDERDAGVCAPPCKLTPARVECFRCCVAASKRRSIPLPCLRLPDRVRARSGPNHRRRCAMRRKRHATMTTYEKLREWVIGKPLDPLSATTRQHIALAAFLAWVGLGADGLSSSAYGPEE